MRTSQLIGGLVVAVTALVSLPPLGCPGQGRALKMAVWGMPFEDRLFEDVYARGFEALRPGVQVDYQRYVNVMPKYEAWHAVGRGADVMRLPITDYYACVEKGMIADLTPLMDDPEIGLSADARADFFPWIWDALELDGRYYALPADNAQYGVYYNKTIFDRYNAAHPDAPLTYPSREWTWAELEQAVEALTITGPGGETVQAGIAFDLWAWPFLAFFQQAGGEVWDADKTTTYVNSPAGVRALEFLARLLPPDAPIRSIDMPDTASGPDDQFKVGKVAILLDGSWRAPNVEIEAPDLDFAIAPLPRGERSGIISGSVLWAVSAHSPNRRLAFEMVKWMVAREQSLLYWDKLRVAPPAQLSVVLSEGFKQTGGIVRRGDGAVIVPPMPRERYPERAAWLRAAITPAPDTGEMPGFLVLGPYEADLERELGGALVSAVRGQQSAQAALDEVVRDVHRIIDRDRASKGLQPVQR